MVTTAIEAMLRMLLMFEKNLQTAPFSPMASCAQADAGNSEHGDERRFPDFRPRRSGLVDEVVLLHGLFHCWSLSWVVWKTSNSVHAVACAWVLLEKECRVSVGLRTIQDRKSVV